MLQWFGVKASDSYRYLLTGWKRSCRTHSQTEFAWIAYAKFYVQSGQYLGPTVPMFRHWFVLNTLFYTRLRFNIGFCSLLVIRYIPRRSRTTVCWHYFGHFCIGIDNCIRHLEVSSFWILIIIIFSIQNQCLNSISNLLHRHRYYKVKKVQYGTME